MKTRKFVHRGVLIEYPVKYDILRFFEYFFLSCIPLILLVLYLKG